MNLFTQSFVPKTLQQQLCTCPVVSLQNCTCDKHTLFERLQSLDCPLHALAKPVAEDCLIHNGE